MENKKQNGLTLVEVAIILVVFALAIGGVLKGREMLTNAKLKRLQKDFSGISVALNSYQDRVLQLPGDDSEAFLRFSIYTDGINDPFDFEINGDGDGTINGDWIPAIHAETGNFWKHLRAAGLIPGGGDDDTQPGNPYGGLIGVRDSSLLISGHVVVFGSIEGPIAKLLEARIDDGSPDSGRIQSDVGEALMDGALLSSAGGSYDDSLRYYMAFQL